MAKAMLRALALLFFLVPWHAMAAPPTPFIRLGVVVNASHRLLGHAETVLMAALEESGDFPDTVAPAEYRRTTNRLRPPMRMGPPIPVKRVGAELHVTHVLVVTLESRASDRKHQLFADTSVYDIPADRLIFKQRYFLPAGSLTESTARFIVARLQTIFKKPNAPAQGENGAADSTAPEMSAHEIDAQTKDQGAVEEAPPEVPDDFPGAEAEEEDEGILAKQTHVAVGASMGLRRALLNVNGGKLPLCYCNNGGFGAIMPGVVWDLSFYLNPTLINFGLDVEGFVEMATTQVTTSTNAKLIQQSAFWRLQIAPAYRVHLPARSELHLHMGYAYTSYPLNLGAFPGVSYGTPFVGVTGVVPLWEDYLTLLMEGAYQPLVEAGAQANHLGQPAVGQGAHLMGALRGRLAFLEITARVAWDIVVLPFSGTTALNYTSNYSNVSINDEHLEIGLSVGSRF